MKNERSLAFIGGGNMAGALASGLMGRHCAADQVLIIDPNVDLRTQWAAQGTQTAAAPGPALAESRVWLFAVKPQIMAEVVQACRPWLQPDTLVLSIAAGIAAKTIAQWLGSVQTPYERVVRCMPNTPALIAAGVTGMMALPGVSDDDRTLAQTLMQAVGETLWVEDDAAIDAVTAVSGSGPAYVFLFLESIINAGIAQGLAPEQAKQLALGTFQGATELARLSPDAPGVLRERVTSKGGTTAAALAVMQAHKLPEIIDEAVAAAATRAGELAQAFSQS